MGNTGTRYMKERLRGPEVYCLFASPCEIRDKTMANVTYGPHLLTENDIPGSSLSGRNPESLKNPELRFWLKCRGDSCKSLTTKAQLVKR